MLDLSKESPFIGMLGFQINKMEGGRSDVSVEVRKELLNSAGILHGGLIASLIDSAAGAAAYSLVEEEQLSLTTDLTIAYLTNVSKGVVHCFAEAVYKGSRRIHVEARVECDEKLLAKGGASFIIVEKSGSWDKSSLKPV